MVEVENKTDYIKKSVEGYKNDVENEQKKVKRERDKLYSREYRKRLKNGNVWRTYKINPNTKKVKKLKEQIEKLNKRIKRLKGELMFGLEQPKYPTDEKTIIEGLKNE